MVQEGADLAQGTHDAALFGHFIVLGTQQRGRQREGEFALFILIDGEGLIADDLLAQVEVSFGLVLTEPVRQCSRNSIFTTVTSCSLLPVTVMVPSMVDWSPENVSGQSIVTTTVAIPKKFLTFLKNAIGFRDPQMFC